MHGGARGVLPRIETGIGHPLASIEIRRQRAQFPQELHGAGFTDAGNAVEEFKAFGELRILGDQLAGLLGQALDGPFLRPQTARQVTSHHGGNGR
jgi:hypothetical protein